MRLLVVGGAGKVGSILVPRFAREHSVTVLDRSVAVDDGVQRVAGDVADPATWDSLDPVDGLVFLAMARPGRDPESAAAQLRVQVVGLYLALAWAARSGVRTAVYASSLTVFATSPGDHYPPNDAAPDATAPYGLAKRFGEDVARASAAESGMTVTSLRLAHPATDDEWADAARSPLYGTATAPDDLARAFSLALERTGPYGVAPVSGDATGRYVDLAPTRDLLGWEPRERLAAERAWPVRT